MSDERFEHFVSPPKIVSGQTSDEEKFAMMISHVRAVAEPYLTEMWGERCPDFDPGCYCCMKWKLLDELLENPIVKVR